MKFLRSKSSASSFLAFFCFFVLLLPGARAGEEEKKEYGRAILLSPEGKLPAKSDGTCVGFIGEMSAGDFFLGLTRIKKGAAVEFYKAGKLVHNFPDKIKLEIQIHRVSCDQTQTEPDVPDVLDLGAIPLPGELVRSFRFQAKWQRNSESQPGALLSTELIPPQPWCELRCIWRWRLRVSAKDVPLTKALEVFVLSEQGEEVQRLSARL